MMAEVDVQKRLLDEIKEFINEKWKHSECELCGTDRWMIYPEPTSHAYIPVGDANGVPTRAYYAQPMVAFLPLSCMNCGNLRLIDARTFEKWLRGRDQTAR
jgi:hypothetical protein